VLDDEGRLLAVHDEALDDAGGDDALLAVEVGGWFVDEVDVSGDAKGEDNCHALEFAAGEILDFLVDEIVELEGLVHVGLELRVQERALDSFEEELADCAGEFWGDLLGFHGDIKGGNALGAVGLFDAGEHFAEGGFSGAVLAHHDDNFGVSEGSGVDAEMEATEGLLHGGILKGTILVWLVIVTRLGNSEGQALLSETQVFGWDVAVKEYIDTFTD
jgi:hypothetical protein